MAKKNTGTRKAAPKKATRKAAGAARTKGAATTRRALRQAGKAVDANLKAIAAADQENSRKRDEREASHDGMAASERAMASAPRERSKASKPDAAEEATERRRRQDRGKDPVVRIARKADRMSGLDLAARIVAGAGEPLNARTIAERAIAAGWKTDGRTPPATLYAAMIREIAAKGKDARFRRTDRGMFAAAGKGA